MDERNQTSTGDLAKLIELADETLAADNDENYVLKLENYARQFDQWFSAYEESVKDQRPLNTREELEELLSRHEKLVLLSQANHSTYADEMIKLKQRSKGIMAYTDTLPKKISFNKVKKG